MKDRIPTHVGRVQLVPVAGQTNVYDMTMADDPVEVGTPLNKASLLKDATAALFGLTDTAVPDDVLALLAQNRARMDFGEYTGTGTYGSANAITLTFPFAPKLVVVLSEDSSYFGPTGSSNIYNSWLMAISGVTKVFVGHYSGNHEVVVSWSGNTISYYTEAAAPGAQCNANNKKYYYIAIG